MQTLALEVSATFIDDAAALAVGACRIVIRALTAPVERLANACDVAGVLPRRRALRRALQPTFRRHGLNRHPWRNRLFPLRALRDLT